MKQSTMEKTRETPKSFEETYPEYPFAELVRLGLSAAQWIVRARRKLRADRGHAQRQSPAPLNAGPVSGSVYDMPAARHDDYF